MGFMKTKYIVITLLFCSFIFNTVNAQSKNSNVLNKTKNGIQNQDWKISSEHVSSTSGIKHTYIIQQINGIDISGTQSSFHLSKDGTIIKANNQFLSAEKLKTAPTQHTLSALDAVKRAANHFKFDAKDNYDIISTSNEETKKTVISNKDISDTDIPVKLSYSLNSQNQLSLVWSLTIYRSKENNYWYVDIDANTGALITKNDGVTNCNFNHDHDSHDNNEKHNKKNNLATTKKSNVIAGGYEVIPFYVESPYLGNREIILNPDNAIASPFGWHDTNGVVGAEHTTTKGNNVDTFENGDNIGFAPDGGAALDFTGYAFDEVYTIANQYESASITNLFYITNIMHDISYQYGFDEAAGNFQQNNYGNGGIDGDFINAEVQNTDLTCNASFLTPEDGTNGVLKAFICDDKDATYDNAIMIHEFAHGISTRLSGGGSDSTCLFNHEQMGEGWSDFYAMILTIKANHIDTTPRYVGNYLVGLGANGVGFRTYPYSTDLAVNPDTYKDIVSARRSLGVSAHRVGQIWMAMLWEMTWGLINEHGYSPDVYSYTGDVNIDAGNIMALSIVTEAMKLQPCKPGFVDGRDAILLADKMLYGGANECIIWDAFAKRGLGLTADQGSSLNIYDGIESYDTPSDSGKIKDFTSICIEDGVVTLSGGFPIGGVYTGQGITDNGNGIDFNFDPSITGHGTYTVYYTLPQNICSGDLISSNTITVKSGTDVPYTENKDFCTIGDVVTVEATPIFPGNQIQWFDAPTGGNLLSTGESYTFTTTQETVVYAQENDTAGTPSILHISEFSTFRSKLEIQNTGPAKDYTGYSVAISHIPYPDINSVNSIIQPLGVMGADSAIFWDEVDGSANHWGGNIAWFPLFEGWIMIIDPVGNVVDSVFWNYTPTEMAALNTTINGFNITAADLDWQGDAMGIYTPCSTTRTRHRSGDTNTSIDFPASDCPSLETLGVYTNTGVIVTCGLDRAESRITIDLETPEFTNCPANIEVSADATNLYSILDYTTNTNAIDNCNINTVIQQPSAGSMVGPGNHSVTLTATDTNGNTTICEFVITVVGALSVEEVNISTLFTLFPNPTKSNVTLLNENRIKVNQVLVYDINGRLMNKYSINSNSENQTISLEEFASGLYFLSVETEKGIMDFKIIKQ